jgi:hypothetical protein
MSKAYVKDVKANASNQGYSEHQTSPACVLTFVRWSNRFPKDYTGDSLDTRDPLVVRNDCLQLQISYQKGTHTPMMSATLAPGDISYEAAVAPGDFVFANILDFESHADEVAEAALNRRPVNGEHDGFKGLFKVHSVRKTLQVNAETGKKNLVFRIDAYGFTEFNNVIYFNPFLLTPAEAQNEFLFITRLGNEWNQLVGNKNVNNVQKIMQILIGAVVGNGVSDEGQRAKNELLRSPNVHFEVPKLVGQLLGLPRAKSARDIYTFLFGVQKYAAGASQEIGAGMNPVVAAVNGRFVETPDPVTGAALIKADYWNQVRAWDILRQYLNSPVNELYTCFRVNRRGAVMPTVVMRQMPFTSEKLKTGFPVTRFLNLPRWRIDPGLLTEVNLGRDETARINFVQVFGRVNQMSGDAQQAAISDQIAAKNYRFDIGDVKRSGLRPYVINSNFDYLENTARGKDSYLSASLWTDLIADAVIGGHLKMNGSVTSAGIEEPIAVGDNLELDGCVYHIEGVQHAFGVSPDGRRYFKTSLALSHGVDLRSSKDQKIFPYMDNPDGIAEQIRDFGADRLLPGISEAQLTTAARERAEGSEATAQPNIGFNPPGTRRR